MKELHQTTQAQNKAEHKTQLDEQVIHSKVLHRRLARSSGAKEGKKKEETYGSAKTSVLPEYIS